VANQFVLSIFVQFFQSHQHESAWGRDQGGKKVRNAEDPAYSREFRPEFLEAPADGPSAISKKDHWNGCGGTPNCGKGSPCRPWARVHGAAPARFPATCAYRDRVVHFSEPMTTSDPNQEKKGQKTKKTRASRLIKSSLWGVILVAARASFFSFSTSSSFGPACRITFFRLVFKITRKPERDLNSTWMKLADSVLTRFSPTTPFHRIKTSPSKIGLRFSHSARGRRWPCTAAGATTPIALMRTRLRAPRIESLLSLPPSSQPAEGSAASLCSPMPGGPR